MRRRCLSKEGGVQMADPLEMQSTPRPLLLLSLRWAGFCPGFCKFLFSIARADFLCEFEWCLRDLPSSQCFAAKSGKHQAHQFGTRRLNGEARWEGGSSVEVVDAARCAVRLK